MRPRPLPSRRQRARGHQHDGVGIAHGPVELGHELEVHAVDARDQGRRQQRDATLSRPQYAQLERDARYLHAVLPSHVLVHPRDHGAILVGWGAAVARTRGGAGLPLPRISKVHADIYPDDVRRGGPADRATDLAMAARCIERAAGARGLLVDRFGSLPAPIGRVVREASRGQHHDAWALRDRLDEIARQAYGPPRYSPLRMPGWGGTSAD